jgi:hypothetical protein
MMALDLNDLEKKLDKALENEDATTIENFYKRCDHLTTKPMTKSQTLRKELNPYRENTQLGIEFDAKLKAFAEAVACEYFHEMCRSDKIVTLDEFINKLFEKEEDNDGKDGEKLTR